MVVIACVLQDVVTALTVAYDILVGGLLVPILGGLVWRRGTNVGALAAMAVGTVATLVAMFSSASRPTSRSTVGLVSGLVVYVIGSLVSKPTDPEVLAEWDRRSRGRIRRVGADAGLLGLPSCEQLATCRYGSAKSFNTPSNDNRGRQFTGAVNLDVCQFRDYLGYIRVFYGRLPDRFVCQMLLK